MIIRKIIKIAATRCHVLELKCTKFDSDGAPPQTPLEELTTLPRPLVGFKGLTFKGRGAEGRGREGRGGERRAGEDKGWQGKVPEGRGGGREGKGRRGAKG